MKFKNSNLVGQDNQTILLGTGSDVDVLFDGSDFLVRTVAGSKNMIKATPSGDIILYRNGAAVLRCYDITGGGIYGIELNGQSGHKGVWFFVSDNMALANQELGGLIQLNATQLGGSTVNIISGDPDGGAALFFNDFKTIETLAAGIILGDGTRTSTETIVGGDTAQLKITGNDLDIQVDQATGKINLKDNSGATVLAISSTGIEIITGAMETNTGTPKDLTLDCGTEKTLVLSQAVWKDINLGAAQLTGPASGQPDFDSFADEGGGDTGIDTYAFAVGEKVHGAFEMQHDYKEGTDISFHLHFQGKAAPSGTDNVAFQLTYTISRDDETLDAATVITSPDTPFDTQYDVKRVTFADISGSTGGNNGGAIQIGDQFLFTLERVAAAGDAYAGDALLMTAGVHYQVDTMGSRQIGTK